jgi:hypothetical protein
VNIEVANTSFVDRWFLDVVDLNVVDVVHLIEQSLFDNPVVHFVIVEASKKREILI